ncbi:ATP-dependent DNA helicase RecG [Clostridia bacterium]|nr:ATP-dependent DNA helicase RecG [Clostridia bacterium]
MYRKWQNMIFGKESEILEFKKTTAELNEGVVSIASILNKHGGGELYFGIRNDGTVLGQQIGESTLRDVSQAIANHIEPRIFPKIDMLSIDEKSCIRVIFEGVNTPYFAFGRLYERVADEDKQLTVAEVESLFRRKITQISDWDSTVSDIGLDDISEAKLKAYMQKAIASGRIAFEYTTKEEVLGKLNLLLPGGNPCNAASVMFGESPRLEIQMAIFATEEKLTFNDIRREQGTITELVNVAEKYIINNIRWRAVIDGSSLQRQEIPEIPIVAAREALNNSYAHKDFRVPQINEVAIYSNRIEIYNPGTFPVGLSPEDFLDGSGKSVHRNPLLAKTMYYSKDIESFGTGLKRIADACNEAGVKYEFKPLPLGFSVIFYRPEIHVVGTDDKADEKTDDKKRRFDVILQYLGTHEYITTSTVKELFGIRNTAAKDVIKKMIDAGLLVPQGGNKTRKYYLK